MKQIPKRSSKLRSLAKDYDASDAFKTSPGLCCHTPGVIGVFGRLVVGVLLCAFVRGVGGSGLVDRGVLCRSHGAVVGVRRLWMLSFGLGN